MSPYRVWFGPALASEVTPINPGMNQLTENLLTRVYKDLVAGGAAMLH